MPQCCVEMSMSECFRMKLPQGPDSISAASLSFASHTLPALILFFIPLLFMIILLMHRISCLEESAMNERILAELRVQTQVQYFGDRAKEWVSNATELMRHEIRRELASKFEEMEGMVFEAEQKTRAAEKRESELIDAAIELLECKRIDTIAVNGQLSDELESSLSTLTSLALLPNPSLQFISIAPLLGCLKNPIPISARCSTSSFQAPAITKAVTTAITNTNPTNATATATTTTTKSDTTVTNASTVAPSSGATITAATQTMNSTATSIGASDLAPGPPAMLDLLTANEVKQVRKFLRHALGDDDEEELMARILEDEEDVDEDGKPRPQKMSWAEIDAKLEYLESNENFGLRKLHKRLSGLSAALTQLQALLQIVGKAVLNQGMKAEEGKKKAKDGEYEEKDSGEGWSGSENESHGWSGSEEESESESNGKAKLPEIHSGSADEILDEFLEASSAPASVSASLPAPTPQTRKIKPLPKKGSWKSSSMAGAELDLDLKGGHMSR